MLIEKKKIILISIIFLAAFLRFYKLGIVPVGVTNDELGYIFNAYSLAKTGRNIFGEFLPFLTWITPAGWPFLPVPMYLIVPFFKLVPLSATTGRLPFVILGVLDVVLIFILVRLVSKKDNLAFLSALFLAISPWHTFFSRSAYDTNVAVFFYFLGIVLFLWEVKKKRLPIFCSLSFWLAVFSYRGMTPLFFFLIPLLAWYGAKFLKMNRQQLLAFIVGVGIIILSLAVVIQKGGSKYVAEALIDKAKMQEEIDLRIRQAQGPLLLRRVFLNKGTYILQKLKDNYLDSFSPGFLFLRGEGNQVYSIWSRGKLYSLDAVFILLGIYYFLILGGQLAVLLILLLLISGIPGMFGGPPYSARNLFASVIFPIFTAGGVIFLINKISKQWLKFFLVGIVVLGYLYLFGSFLFDYYGRYALYGAEPWFKSLKEMSFVIEENKTQYDKIMVVSGAYGDLIQYAFWGKINPQLVQQAWQTQDENSYYLGKVSFEKKCLEEKAKNPWLIFGKDKKTLGIVREGFCYNQATPSAYIKDFYGNPVWKIYE